MIFFGGLLIFAIIDAIIFKIKNGSIFKGILLGIALFVLPVLLIPQANLRLPSALILSICGSIGALFYKF